MPSNTLLISLLITYVTGIWYHIQVAPVFTISFVITSILIAYHYAHNY